ALDMREPWIRRAADWLRSKQNDDGGWGESCLSDRDPRWRGRGASTASQTAWALLGLIAAENEPGDAVHRGVHYLLERQLGRFVERRSLHRRRIPEPLLHALLPVSPLFPADGAGAVSLASRAVGDRTARELAAAIVTSRGRRRR